MKDLSKTATNSRRTYACGCGKKYLSYPALYTHIKNKHQGKAPQGSSQMNNKPGRPRKSPPASDVSEFDLLQGVGLHKEESWTPPVARPMFSLSFVRTVKSTHTCSDIFALYSETLPEILSAEGFEEFSQHIELLKKCLDQYGWQLAGESPQENYCATHDAALVPQISNFFVQDFLPKEAPGDREVAIVFMFHLCSWLLRHSYTTYKLSLATS